MMRTSAWLLIGLLGCTKAGSNQEAEAQPEPIVVTAQARMPAPAPPTPPAPPPPSPAPAEAVSKVTVQMTAATLADDCGGTPPRAVKSDEASNRESKAKSASAKADRACDQTSMQLSVKASADGDATRITVKVVELFDTKGVKIGTLTASSPTVWTKGGTYKKWTQTIAPGQQLSVSYVLSQPPWAPVAKRRARMYVLKAVITVGGNDQVVKREVMIAAETSMPATMKT